MLFLRVVVSTLSIGIALVVHGAPASASARDPGAVGIASAKAPTATSTAPETALGGVYAGPGQTGVTGATAFDSSTATSSAQILDFAATNTWKNIEGPHWMLDPHSGQSARLEYSLPMFPTGGSESLSACAAGTYDDHWATLGTNLIAANLATTVVRPGWEFNGDWYDWSAAGRVADYIDCFRHIVTTLRATPGQHFTFDWNVAVGDTKMSSAAITAYPGDDYVDYVGADVYDTAWSVYSDNVPTSSQQASAWNYLLKGPLGLNYWSAFAASHAKPLALPEWGLAKLGSGHGGGDDPAFITNMFDFIANPTNHVAYYHYFNWDYGTTIHSLTGGQFPNSLTRFQSHSAAVHNLAARSGASGCRAASPVPARSSAPNDFNGDRRTDIAVFRPANGTWYVRGVGNYSYGASGDIPVPGDYTGSGKTDVAVLRPSTGIWSIRGVGEYAYGASGDIPVPGAYTGGGKCSIAVFRPSTGTWHIRGGAPVQYGQSGDIPVPGDYAGDGKTSTAVFRPSTGTWYVRGGGNVIYGDSTDAPVPGDYDGDGKTDVAVYRPSDGTWHIRGVGAVAYGDSTDAPVPGDYNGDGKTDIAVYRPSDGTWHIRGVGAVAYGTSTDIPV